MNGWQNLADITIDTLTQIVGNVSTEDSIQSFLLDADGNGGAKAGKRIIKEAAERLLEEME